MPIVVPVNNADVEVPVATMPIVAAVIAPPVGMQVPVADPQFPPAKRQCRGLGNELNVDYLQERNERDHNLAAPVVRPAAPRPLGPVKEASTPISPAQKAKQDEAAMLVTEKRATEDEAARSAAVRAIEEDEQKQAAEDAMCAADNANAAEDAVVASDSDDSDDSEEEDNLEDEGDMPFELADGNLMRDPTTESAAFCDNVLNMDWGGYDNE